MSEEREAERCPSRLRPDLRCEKPAGEHQLCAGHDGPILWVWGTPDEDPDALLAAEREKVAAKDAEIARLRAVVERLRDMPGPEADPDSHAEEEATETWWPFWAGFALSLRREARRALEREEP